MPLLRVTESVNEFVSLLPPEELEDPRRWAGPAGFRKVRLVEADGATLRLALVHQQWLLKKRRNDHDGGGAQSVASAAAPVSASASGSVPTIVPTVRCCIAGWADPLLHTTVSSSWCGGAPDRRAKCAASRQRTAWYTQCAPRAPALGQPSCFATGRARAIGAQACPWEFGCRAIASTPVYSFKGNLSSRPDASVPLRGSGFI